MPEHSHGAARSPDCQVARGDETGLRSTWEVSLQVGVRIRPVMVTGVRHSPVTAVQVRSDKAEPRPGQAVSLQVRVRETQGWARPWAWARAHR